MRWLVRIVLAAVLILCAGWAPPTPTQAVRPGGYEALLGRIHARQTSLAARHAAAPPAAKDPVLRDASACIEHALADSIWPCWLGTAWDFNGTTQTPGSGKIACGYFVTTCLRDVGYKVQRVKWAQLGSQAMIERLMGPGTTRRYANVPVGEFARSMVRAGDGVYVVGLNSHVGFLLVRDGEVWFCHSSYVPPGRVVIERAEESSPLIGASVRVVGRIVPNDEMTRQWFEGAPKSATVTSATTGRDGVRDIALTAMLVSECGD